MLRLLRREVKAAAESTTEKVRLAGLLRTESARAVQAYGNVAVIDAIRANVIASLEPALAPAALEAADVGKLDVGKRSRPRRKGRALAGPRQIRNSVTSPAI